VKVDGKPCTVEQAYDLFVSDGALVSKLEATHRERESFTTYAVLRMHHDYLRDLEAAHRGGRSVPEAARRGERSH